ncbi:hypothetical protein [Schlesneria paludicola]|uniref:hypothetical protein n=1 Tax=Schlesneria paludicola TaxID=360056 RepID=UPI00029B1D43|nr:hypothetical protein [Schlesneria paludicola]
MGNFFHSRRRRLGILFLLCSGAFVVGWVRSLFLADLLVTSMGQRWIINVRSDQCGLGVIAAAYGSDSPSLSGSWSSHPIDPASSSDPMSEVSVPVRLDLPGFHFGCSGSDLSKDRYYAICFISYWLIVIPLLLITSFLLFSHRSTRKPSSLVEVPAAPEVSQ